MESGRRLVREEMENRKNRLVTTKFFSNEDGEEQTQKLYWRHYNEDGEEQMFENQQLFFRR